MPKIFVHIDDEDRSPCRMLVQQCLRGKELIFSLPSAIQSQLLPTLQHHADIDPEGTNLVFILDHELNRDQAFVDAQPNTAIVPTGKDIAEQMRVYFPKCKLVSVSSCTDERSGKLLIKADGMDYFAEMCLYMRNVYPELEIISISAASELPNDLETALVRSGLSDYPNGTIFIHKSNVDKLGGLCNYFTGEITPQSHQGRSPGSRRSSPSSGHAHHRHRSSPINTKVIAMDKAALPPPPPQAPPLSPSGPIPLLVTRSFPSEQLLGSCLHFVSLGLGDMTSLNAASSDASPYLPYTSTTLKQVPGVANPVDTSFPHIEVLSERRQSTISTSFSGTSPTASLSTGSVLSGTMIVETKSTVLRTEETVLTNTDAPSDPSTTTLTLTTVTLLEHGALDDSFPSLNASRVAVSDSVVDELTSTNPTQAPSTGGLTVTTTLPHVPLGIPDLRSQSLVTPLMHDATSVLSQTGQRPGEPFSGLPFTHASQQPNSVMVALSTTREAFFGASAPSTQIKDSAPQPPLPSSTDDIIPLTTPSVDSHAFEEERTIPIQKRCCSRCSIQ